MADKLRVGRIRINGSQVNQRAPHARVLPVPGGPQTTRFSRRWIHSRARSADWVGAGIDDSAGSQAAKVLPVGNPARVRRVVSAERSRPEPLRLEEL